jgi:hypothetical protein
MTTQVKTRPAKAPVAPKTFSLECDALVNALALVGSAITNGSDEQIFGAK